MILDKLLLIAIAATLSGNATPHDESLQEACCFQNSRYTGTCQVEPSEGETCASILAYLNNPLAEGKNYCGGTSVRQGWTQVSCEEGSSSGKSEPPVKSVERFR